MIYFELAGAPRGKERVKQARDGHSYTPERTVTFEGRLAYAAQLAMGDRPPFEGPLRLEVTMHMPIPASKPKAWRSAALRGDIRPTVKPDWDNGGKLTDALNLIVWIDDKQIVSGHVEKWYSDRPRTEVRVTPINPAEGIFA
ncbi:RusA family crossover junction endodeoxyribonuclease [Rhodopseudomonas pseudopalustris]|uniref:Holliday junction resolvase RusA (Prophage-encoded endonuclease) n=1 Tax=Rhodopseudomonas pseudopalustris TaxID=1513892 RepID=A0A1H8WGW2_9BRAD|nr:RusA family crossover junction endodeoxyribonuclease [Rhodopseudomonas pseudopalustris]SEP26866.1 Holliday junction resolvase RusA (prophage-encoded endonuclease) [Rhodopseudomonas pseudopalustris]